MARYWEGWRIDQDVSSAAELDFLRGIDTARERCYENPNGDTYCVCIQGEEPECFPQTLDADKGMVDQIWNEVDVAKAISDIEAYESELEMVRNA